MDERNPRHGQKKSGMRNGCSWCPQDGLAGTGWGQSRAWEQQGWGLLTQGRPAASNRSLPVPLSWQGSGWGAVLAVVQPALLREPCTKESSEAVSGVSQPCWVMFEKISRCSMMGTSRALRRMGALREPSAPALSCHPTGMSSVPTLQCSSQ